MRIGGTPINQANPYFMGIISFENNCVTRPTSVQLPDL
jgi:hypothetical protein